MLVASHFDQVTIGIPNKIISTFLIQIFSAVNAVEKESPMVLFSRSFLLLCFFLQAKKQQQFHAGF